MPFKHYKVSYTLFYLSSTIKPNIFYSTLQGLESAYYLVDPIKSFLKSFNSMKIFFIIIEP
jgi:hypothetical protein